MRGELLKKYYIFTAKYPTQAGEKPTANAVRINTLSFS